MRVKNIKNISKKRVSILTSDNTEISLPPNVSYDENIDVTNIKELGEKVSYTADLTEVGETSSNQQKLYD